MKTPMMATHGVSLQFQLPADVKEKDLDELLLGISAILMTHALKNEVEEFIDFFLETHGYPELSSEAKFNNHFPEGPSEEGF